jgi:hypothetical protein
MNPNTLPFHWKVIIECKDCSESYEVLDPDPTVKLVEEKKRTRWVMLSGIPNECPKCHNLRVVSPAPPK